MIKSICYLAQKGYLNSVVIDMKDEFGRLRYNSNLKIARNLGIVAPTFDVKKFLDTLRACGIKKVIARVVCFKDSNAALFSDFGIRDNVTKEVWKNYKGLCWLNPYNKRVWKYLGDVIEEVQSLGFDEIQLDYIRFPTDGDLSRCLYYGIWGRRDEAIKEFLKYIRERTKLPLSVDVFGYATWRPLEGEGQNLEKMSEYVDFICPMLYPSHFAPYEMAGAGELWRTYFLYHESIRKAKKVSKKAKLIAYIQGFNYKSPKFSPEYIFTQILGAIDAGAEGFFVWNAEGKYETTFQALKWVPTLEKRLAMRKRSLLYLFR